MRNLALCSVSALAGLAILGVGSSTAWAALAPNHQRLAELQAVLTHPGVIAAFPVSQPIDKVEYVKPDLYRVTAGACHADVRIVPKPNKTGMVGPRQFTVEPGKPVCP